MVEAEKQTTERHPASGSHVPEFHMMLTASALATAYASSRLRPDGAGPNVASAETVAATHAALEAFAPADEVEAMLAAQAFALHSAVMESLRRAAHPADDDVSAMFERAADLGRTMLATVEALDRRRAARRPPVSPHAASAEAAS